MGENHGPSRRTPQPRLESATMIKATALIFSAALALTACGPSIDAAAKADIDARVSRLTPAPHVFGTPTANFPVPIAVGQWAQYKFVDDKGQPSFLTMKIVGQVGAAFFYETVTEAYTGKTAMKMLVDFGDRRSPESINILQARLRDQKGEIIDYPPSLIGMMNATLRGALGPITITWQGLPQEDAVVPAGRFVGCFKADSTAAWGPFRSASRVWSHPAVPLSGMVRSQGLDSPTAGELVAFGMTGATSEL